MYSLQCIPPTVAWGMLLKSIEHTRVYVGKALEVGVVSIVQSTLVNWGIYRSHSGELNVKL